LNFSLFLSAATSSSSSISFFLLSSAHALVILHDLHLITERVEFLLGDFVRSNDLDRHFAALVFSQHHSTVLAFTKILILNEQLRFIKCISEIYG
jgi:hypothetical protein